MTEEKRAKFESWLFAEHTLPKQSISYTAEELLFELWGQLSESQKREAELQKDAARYRWLRHGDLALLDPFQVDGMVPEGDKFDEAVDSAMRANPDNEKD